MKHLFIFLVAALLGSSAYAYVHPEYRDIKLATQSMLEHQTISAPAHQNGNLLLNATVGPTGAGTKTVSSFLAQPDAPRNIVVSPGASAGGDYGAVKAGNVVVSGTDYLGNSISENIAITDGETAPATGAKAFKTVTSVLFPAENIGFGATWSVGTGNKLGLKSCMARAGDIAWSDFAGVRDATLPTIASNESDVSSNTATVTDTLNGASDVDLFFIQNFRCHP